MRKYLIPATIVPLVAIASAAGCGHSKKTMEAFEASRTDGGAGTDDGATGGASSLPEFEFSCSEVDSQQFDPISMQSYEVPATVVAEVEATLAAMTPAHKASQMMGLDVGAVPNYRDIERSPDVDVPGIGKIRGYNYRDAGRGVNMDAGQHNRPDDKNNFATAFPSPSLRAASWDVSLERRIGAAIGDETAASKNNMNLAPCMNIVRHPFWGRTQETYGEDMYAIGRMASAFTVGVQEYVVACAKHWAGNNVEFRRSLQNAVMDEQTLREIYGRHFEMVVQDAGIGCIMNAYNKINGIKATQNRHVMREVLKGPVSEGGFGFQGMILTDWWAMPGDQELMRPASTIQAETIEAVNAGTDIEVPWTLHYSVATLANADQIFVEDAARRVLTQKFLFKTATEDDGWGKKKPTSTLTNGSITANPAHEALAEEAVVKSAVLVHNGPEGAPVLPLTSAAAKIAVVGPDQYFTQIQSSVPKSCGSKDPDIPQGSANGIRDCTFHFAVEPALGDRGSSRVNADPARSVGPFRGIADTAGADHEVVNGNTPAAAADADAVVVVVGYTPGDEGEEYYIAAGGDRSTLNLPEGHNDFVSQVLDLGKPTIIIIESGSIVNLPWLNHANKNQATVWAGYPGQRGGLAFGKLIFGEANFAGKMPMAWPQEADLMPFKETQFETQMGYFFGYRDFDHRQYVEGEAINLLYPFGHGLSYSTFEYGDITVPCETVTKEAIFQVTVDVTNTSDVDGDEVVMLFVKPPEKPSGVTGARPWKELKSFTRVSVPAGETVTAKLPVRVRDLRRWEGGESGKWIIDSGNYTLLVGKDALDAESGAHSGVVTVNGD